MSEFTENLKLVTKVGDAISLYLQAIKYLEFELQDPGTTDNDAKTINYLIVKNKFRLDSLARQYPFAQEIIDSH